MQSIKYVGVVKPVKVLEDDKIGPRYLEIIDDLIEVFIKVAGIILFQFKLAGPNCSPLSAGLLTHIQSI